MDLLALEWLSREESMDEARLQYVEDFGVLFEQAGGSRMLGRVLGALLISDPPELSAEELARELKASRGSISQATRTLVQMGMVRRLTRPGERRDYFRVRPHAWQETTRQQMSLIGVFQEMAERGLKLLNSDNPEARDGLEEMRDFYAFWEKELPAVLERWDQEKARRDREAG